MEFYLPFHSPNPVIRIVPTTGTSQISALRVGTNLRRRCTSTCATIPRRLERCVEKELFEQPLLAWRQKSSILAGPTVFSACVLGGMLCKRNSTRQKRRRHCLKAYPESSVDADMSQIQTDAYADPNAVTVREVYRMLSAAPSMGQALRLAARLRRSARDGRILKDGRVMVIQNVDTAMDEVLKAVERRKAIQVAETEAKRSDQQEQIETHATVDDNSDRSSGDSSSSKQSRSTDNVNRRNKKKAQPAPVPPRAKTEGVWNPWDEEDPEDVQQPATNTNIKPPPQKRFLETAQAKQGRFQGNDAQSTETDSPEGGIEQEVRDKIVNNKYNYVDRVWSSPDAFSLPLPPALEVDATIPKDSWLRLPHVAVNGMTNCGKSSLINHCLRWNYAAKASSRAGRTTSIDFYCVNERFVLVDFPGYPDPDEIAHLGVLRDWERDWEELVFRYLQRCGAGHYDLRMVLQLQNSRKRPSRTCIGFTEELRRLNLPTLVVLTKDDQLKKGHLERNYWATQVKKRLQYEGPHLHYTTDSSLPFSRKARRSLHRWIRSVVSVPGMDEAHEVLQKAWANKVPSK